MTAPKRYRKKPVAIEAMQLTENNIEEVGDWISDHDINVGGTMRYVEIHTLEGVMRADIGDWVIKGVKGEFYPCKPDVFEATYEPAEVPR